MTVAAALEADTIFRSAGTSGEPCRATCSMSSVHRDHKADWLFASGATEEWFTHLAKHELGTVALVWGDDPPEEGLHANFVTLCHDDDHSATLCCICMAGLHAQAEPSQAGA
jgi:hypothetical protein